MPDSCAAFGCTIRRSSTSLQFHRISSAKRYPERRIQWVTAMRREKQPIDKISNTRICSAHFATVKPSYFSRAQSFPTISSVCQQKICVKN